MRLNALEVDDMGGQMALQIEPIEYEQYDHARQTGANESGPTHFFDQYIFIIVFSQKQKNRTKRINFAPKT